MVNHKNIVAVFGALIALCVIKMFFGVSQRNLTSSLTFQPRRVFAFGVKLDKEIIKIYLASQEPSIAIFPQFWQSLRERQKHASKKALFQGMRLIFPCPQYHGRTLRGEWQWRPMGQKAYQLRRKLPLLLTNVVVGVVSVLLIVSFAFSISLSIQLPDL